MKLEPDYFDEDDDDDDDYIERRKSSKSKKSGLAQLSLYSWNNLDLTTCHIAMQPPTPSQLYRAGCEEFLTLEIFVLLYP